MVRRGIRAGETSASPAGGGDANAAAAPGWIPAPLPQCPAGEHLTSIHEKLPLKQTERVPPKGGSTAGQPSGLTRTRGVLPKRVTYAQEEWGHGGDGGVSSRG